MHEMGTLVSLSIYLLTNLVGFKWTFIFTMMEEVCECLLEREKERERATEREREIERKRDGDCEAH